MSHALFEISWEVCNKVGGIHTVLSSKAQTAVAQYGDDYVTVGPWLLSDVEKRDLPFDEDPAYSGFADICRGLGLPVRVGRWRIPGSPRCILVEFSSLYDQKDDLLAELWEDFKVDSLEGGWDYGEPVLFGLAAGRVIEEYWEHFLAPHHKRAVVQAHEWMTGSALLHLKRKVPAIGTVFTTHATMLGRALSSLGNSPADGLGDESADELAKENHVTAKHSMEGTSAREADVFTTVSQVTAREAELLHHRAPKPVLPNGIDMDVIAKLVGPESDHQAIRAQLEHFASCFLGTPDLGDAAFLAISGRYEFHNKGIDLLLDALGECDKQEGRPIVLWVLVPAGNSGVRIEVRERLEAGVPSSVQDPIGIATHNLFDEEQDPVHKHCAELGLSNATGARVKVIQVPIYLRPDDGMFEREYEAVLSAMDLGVFPSFYEPWGYTPQESLAVGVPTITSDYAGFGRWAINQKLGDQQGISIVKRVGESYNDCVTDLAARIEQALMRSPQDLEALRAICSETAGRTAWSDLFQHYREAYREADAEISKRASEGIPLTRRPRPTVAVSPAAERTPRLRWFDVATSLPQALRPLESVARNFWWCWDPDAPSLFEEIDPEAWERAHHNPVRLLKRADLERLEACAADEAFCMRVKKVADRLQAYLAERADKLPLGEDGAAFTARHPIAYFCAEYALHESMPIYSGGLGVLAGDHLKSASDLNLPFVAVGMFYRMGYMSQRLSAAGEQLVVDRENDPAEMAIDPIYGDDGKRLEISLALPGRELILQAWRVLAGRVTLYLLDANVPANREEDRDITRNLYGGDHEMRMKQLIVLGRGGARLLTKLGIEPAAYHMNEGHAAFLSLERMAKLMQQQGLTFEAAREKVRATTAFTTHTPVPAGHDRFGEELMRRYFSDVAEWAGVPWERFMRLGRADKESSDEFNMSYLALSFTAWCNGVSRIHGEVSRGLLHPFWPSLLEHEVPIDSVTNGVHLPTWTSPKIAALMGVDDRPINGEDFATKASSIDPGEYWRTHLELKAVLAKEAKRRIRQSFIVRNDSPVLASKITDGFDEDALWIGFARRFAPYKRAHLLFQDVERLRWICDHAERPVRFLIAGKAHPADQRGQEILKTIAEFGRTDELAGRVIFLEDYDIDLARNLVQGVDVWLNNPTRTLEASGTSGMKVSANGGLNLSIADGWWPEAADGRNGWTIGADDKVYAEQGLQDQLDAEVLYRMLEEEIAPLYFDRDEDGVPIGWVERCMHALQTIPPVFDTDRMVGEYLDKAYTNLGRGYFEIRRDKGAAQRIASEAQRIRKSFADIQVLEARVTDLSTLHAGDTIEAVMRVDIGSLNADDVEVELVLGRADDDRPDDIEDMAVMALQSDGKPDGNTHSFAGSITMEQAGRYAQGLRIRPRRLSSSPSSLRDLALWA